MYGEREGAGERVLLQDLLDCSPACVTLVCSGRLTQAGVDLAEHLETDRELLEQLLVLPTKRECYLLDAGYRYLGTLADKAVCCAHVLL